MFAQYPIRLCHFEKHLNRPTVLIMLDHRTCMPINLIRDQGHPTAFTEAAAEDHLDLARPPAQFPEGLHGMMPQEVGTVPEVLIQKVGHGPTGSTPLRGCGEAAQALSASQQGDQQHDPPTVGTMQQGKHSLQPPRDSPHTSRLWVILRAIVSVLRGVSPAWGLFRNLHETTDLFF